MANIDTGSDNNRLEQDDLNSIEDGYRDLEVGDGCLPPPSPIRAYIPSPSPYISGQGVARYHSALKSLIPLRKQATSRERIGVDDAGFFSFICYSWLSNLMYKAYRRGLQPEDLPQGSPLDSCDYNAQRLEMMWQNEVAARGPTGASFSRVVWRFIRTRVLADWFAYTGSVIMGFLTPIVFMRNLLEYAEDPEGDVVTGVTWALCLTASELLRTMFFSWHWAMTQRTAVRLRSGCLALLYKKVIRMNFLGEQSMGELINVFGNDAQRIFDMVLFGPMIIGGPLVMICGVFYILWLLGPWALFGIMVFIIYYPIQYAISRLYGILRGKTVVVSDERISLMSDMLNYIKLIKMYAWENTFIKNVHSKREQEHNLLQRTSFLNSFSGSMAPTIPIISAIVTFLAHLSSGSSLTASQAFSVLVFLTKNIQISLSLIRESFMALYEGSHSLHRTEAFPFIAVLNSQVRNSINTMQYGLMNTFEAVVAFKRIKRILLLEEVKVHIARPIDRTQAVSIGGAKFAWDVHSSSPGSSVLINVEAREDEAEKEQLHPDLESKRRNELVEVLFDISFSASKGHLVGVCGMVGSGKSALLLAIMGQMRLLSGQLARDGTCAYVSQQAWVLNGTLRENILFGESFDKKRYFRVIHSCALNEDLNQLPGEDQTEIGERGVNLSGGQKQRVALARALYANRDIYLLDDPLSAVDVNVGSHIFENCIRKDLQNKTVILVTHQVNYLSQCSRIYFMKDGRIVECGTHKELLEMSGEYSSMVSTSVQEMPGQSSSIMQASDQIEIGSQVRSTRRTSIIANNKSALVESTVNGRGGEKLTVEEQTHHGSIKNDTYFSYIYAAGGHFVTFIVFFVFFTNVGSTAFSSWWLAMWIKAGGGNTTIEVNNQTVLSTNLADNPDFGYYQQVYGCTIVLILLTSFVRCFVFNKATLRASTFLHNQLFEKMIHSPMLFFESNPSGRLQNLFSRDMDEVDSRLPATVENILQNTWTVSFAIMFICMVFPWFFIPLIPSILIYYFISRVFRKAVRDLKRIENKTRSPIFSSVAATVQGLSTIHAFSKESDFINRFSKMYDENSTCNYLWNVAMRWLAVRIDSLAVVTMSITAFFVILLHGVVPPAMAGLALAYSWHISGVFQYTIRLISETEVRFISVERIQTYIETMKMEGQEKAVTPQSGWPSGGQICFRNVSLRYREGLPDALNNVTFNVLSGEKIGIVGRTGSGKSSLTVALFRLVELSAGRITLDGIDISKLPLPILRSKLSIIPQDPVLFCGTIRTNLDPEDSCTDAQIWEALTKTKLSDRVSAMPLKLNTVVGTGADCLSVGERQLLCLARALLRKSKILILDEATASVDPETEAEVQTIIQSEFEHCSVLTIAHRLTNVSNCHRILVMEHGKVQEFDSPSNLLKEPSSAFAKMVTAAGISIRTLMSSEH